jgi:ADP-heptose:LPS heptosyltransferase
MNRLKARLLVDLYVGGILHSMLKPAVLLLGKVLGRDHHLERCREVTFLKLLGGGSLVLAYPALLALRRTGRIDKIRLIGTPATAAFGRLLGIFDEVLVIRDQRLALLAVDAVKVIFHLLRTDAIVDLEIHSRLSTILSLLTLARNRIGAYTEDSFWRRGLSTHLLYYNKSAPVYGFYDQVAELFEAPLPIFDSAIAEFRALVVKTVVQPLPIAAHATDLALAPCCSELGRERMLRDEEWIPVLQRALDARTELPAIHLLGGPGDRPFLERLRGTLSAAFPHLVFHNHAGALTLEQSALLLQQIGCLLAIDSALLHLARLQGVPTISYWGPTDPATRLKPSSVALDVLHYHRIACSPCVHIASEPPCFGNNLCMRLAVNPQAPLPQNPIWLAEPRPNRSAHEPATTAPAPAASAAGPPGCPLDIDHTKP